MGRRGRTGAGGAVVSSLSTAPGGTLRGGNGGGSRKASGGIQDDGDVSLQPISKKGGKKKKNQQQQNMPGASAASARAARGAADAASASASTASGSSGWLGKSPTIFLREWCTRNNRKRPSFSPMRGPDPPLYRCIIPAGRKDGSGTKGLAYAAVVGVGLYPGQEYAALNVLHQIERGKPLERVLAPEFRGAWLELDARYAEEAVAAKNREEGAAKRKAAKQRAERNERQKETIAISAASRLAIEDALLGTGAGENGLYSVNEVNVESIAKVKKELVRLKFSELDAQAAAARFGNVEDALDYLCLNLDESELPERFAPKGDIEVVTFYARHPELGGRQVPQQLRDELADMLCVSRASAARAIRDASGDRLRALATLYHTLVRAEPSQAASSSSACVADAERMEIAEQLRREEAETLSAIFGEDACVGVGSLPKIENVWAAVVTLRYGIPGLQCSTSVRVAVVDVDGCYPFTSPMVLVQDGEDGNSNLSCKLAPPKKRAAIRALWSVVTAARAVAGEDEHAFVVHEVVAFLQDAPQSALLAAAGKCALQTKRVGEHNEGTVGKSEVIAKVGAEEDKGKQDKREFVRTIPKPQSVKMLEDTPARHVMNEKRRALPAFQARQEILELLRKNQVIVVSGATGSGKTTQVPQYILEEAAESGEPISIICTQPRRIAAVSVAERVANERGEKPGGTVGFQVKLHAKRTRDTRLVFCTTGVLLRKLQTDHNLDAFTHVVVDEVHERSVETDFLLLLLRDILAKRPTLRVVLMSATLDANKFSQYFRNPGKKFMNDVPVVSIPGRTFPVDEVYLEQCVAMTSYRVELGSRYAKKNFQPRTADAADTQHLDVQSAVRNSASAALAALEPEPPSCSEDEEDDGQHAEGGPPDAWDNEDGTVTDNIGAQLSSVQISSKAHVEEEDEGRSFFLDIEPSREDKEAVKRLDESIVNVDLISALVQKLDRSTKDNSKGAILIFLPGAADISAVVRVLSKDSRLWPLPLHSMLSPDEQALVFKKPTKRQRKVICSSNIAETSITVEDVTMVIDTLKEKEMSYDALNNTSVLQEQFISQAAARQRAGRAGRVQRGVCFRLVRQHTFEHTLANHQTPEIRRVSLEHLVLNFLSICAGLSTEKNPHTFLARALDPPDADAITTAVNSLVQLGALRKLEGNASGAAEGQDVELTALGKILTGLPVDARIGKLLIYGVLLRCIDAALTIAACMSEKSPFYAPFNRREEARIARGSFAWGKSDLLTYVRAYNKWRDFREGRKVKYEEEMQFCEKHFLSRKTLMAIRAQRGQLANALYDAGFGASNDEGGFTKTRWEEDTSLNENCENIRMLKAMICAALYPNIMRIDAPNAMYKEVISGTVAGKLHAKDLKLRAKNGERLFLHPESVNFHEGDYGSRWLAYFAKVKTTRVYVRDSTNVSPYAILLFGGDVGVLHEKGQITVDKWISFKAPARIAVLVRELRRQMDALLLRKFENPALDLVEEGQGVHEAITRLIKTES